MSLSMCFTNPLVTRVTGKFVKKSQSKCRADMSCSRKPQDKVSLVLHQSGLQGEHVCWVDFLLTSVCRMAARCSLAVRDSLSTSICCLQSEFWLLRVSSFVCRASSSDSFFDNSCFSWSICKHMKQTRHTNHHNAAVCCRCMSACVSMCVYRV